jgi:hypothetical protein
MPSQPSSPTPLSAETPALDWLLEPDHTNPGPRYFALVELLHKPPDDSEVDAARQAVMNHGPVPAILAQQYPDGYWVHPGAEYLPKYRGTPWQVIFLAQLAADGTDPRVQAACDYVLTHYPAPYGGLSMSGVNSGLIHCLQGNLCAALIDLGWLEDERFQKGLDWLARSVTGEGIAPSEERSAAIRYLRSGNSAPDFACSANGHLPCAWGAVKVMLALSKVPEEYRSPAIQAALDTGIEFLFSCDPAIADYPMGWNDKPNRSWYKFGYPIAYVADVLQILEVLASLGYAKDARLDNALDLLLSKRDSQGRWKLEYTYNGKTWVDLETKNQPSKWVTLRALRVLKNTSLM